jgi:hypothetical protein
MATPRGRRALGQGPWHYCARCDYKSLIYSELQWQRGKLLCCNCIDKRLIGDREVAIAQVLQDGKEELAPVEKLRNPDFQYTDDDILVN